MVEDEGGRDAQLTAAMKQSCTFRVVRVVVVVVVVIWLWGGDVARGRRQRAPCVARTTMWVHALLVGAFAPTVPPLS